MSEFVPRSIESKGKSIDEAIFRGLQEMGVSIDEVTIVTLQEGSKGILGIGAKPYIIRLTTKPVDLSALEEKRRSERAAARSERAERSRREKGDRPQRGEKPRREERSQPAAGEEREICGSEGMLAAAEADSRQPACEEELIVPQAEEQRGEREEENTAPARRSDRPERSRSRNRNRSRERERVIPPDTTEYISYVAGETECPGADFLTGVLERMGVDSSIGFADTEAALKFRIDSDTMGILIGHRGETLDALQYLTGLVVNRDREEYRRVVLDTENYRNKREDTLIRLARKLAGQVRASGQPIVLEPMNPYERRVLHATLQNNPYVETHSEGEEPNRCVVISPKQ